MLERAYEAIEPILETNDVDQASNMNKDFDNVEPDDTTPGDISCGNSHNDVTRDDVVDNIIHQGANDGNEAEMLEFYNGG
ncbi:hypothetical protein V6N13_103751 [Hibiscus sabdariffa]|uniref:Uncharacterized protein n=2 Tax=Hibiscus sabdariffa TaxID=183260 RepID=A0ABR2NT22_9ROSI